MTWRLRPPFFIQERSPMAITPHEDALSKAKILLMTKPNSVFFTTLCFSLHHKFDAEVPTACTDGKYVTYNPDFFMSLSPEERVFLLLHETMHCAYLHMMRLGEFNPRKWNKATDHVINLQLIERGFKMPEGGLADPQYSGMSAEEVYKLLPEDNTKPMMEDLLPGNDPVQQEETKGNMQDALVRAALQSKMAEDRPGTIPGEIEIFLDRLLNPKLPARKILHKYLNAYTKNDYTFRKPNRRFFPQHYLPTLYSESLGDIAIAVDTSGSVTDEEFQQFISETAGILRMMKPTKISFIQFDTAIKSVNEVRSVKDLMDIHFTGRGGTVITEVIDWVNQNKPQVTLVFTDGEFRFRGENTRNDVIWLIHNNTRFSSPFGKVIHYELKA